MFFFLQTVICDHFELQQPYNHENLGKRKRNQNTRAPPAYIKINDASPLLESFYSRQKSSGDEKKNFFEDVSCFFFLQCAQHYFAFLSQMCTKVNMIHVLLKEPIPWLQGWCRGVAALLKFLPAPQEQTYSRHSAQVPSFPAPWKELTCHGCPT